MDATIIASASEGDGEACWVKHKTSRTRAERRAATGMWGRDEQEALANYGLRRMHWKGLAKAALQVRLTAIAYNMKRTANLLAAA